jgi:membrane protein
MHSIYRLHDIGYLSPMQKSMRPFSRHPIVAWMHRIHFGSEPSISLYQVLELYGLGVLKGALTTRASSIAFSFFMALFPFLLFVLNLIPFIPLADIETTFSELLISTVPTDIQTLITDILSDIQNKPRGGLLSSTFLLSIFLMGNGVNAVFGGFEDSIHVDFGRNFLRQYLYAVFVGILLAILLLVSVAGYLFFELMVQESSLWEIRVSPWLRSLFFVFMSYWISALLFYFGSTKASGRSLFSAGALVTTLLFMLTSYGFTLYLDYFATYNQLYGSIGAILILMLYIWLNANVLLLGFELNAAIGKLKQDS